MAVLPDSITLAVSTGSFWPANTLEAIKACQELGQVDIELTLQQHEFWLSFARQLQMPLLPILKSLYRDGGLRVTAVHAPHMVTEHGYSSRARADYLREAIRVCQQLGGRVVDIHPFHIFTSYEQTHDYLAGNASDVWEALLPETRQLLEQAQQAGILLCLENVILWEDDRSGFFNIPESMGKLLSDVGHPALGFTLDVVHAHLGRQLEAFVEQMSEHVNHLHLADLAPPLKRVPPGEGVLPWEELGPFLGQMPRLRLATVELGGSSAAEVSRAVGYLRG